MKMTYRIKRMIEAYAESTGFPLEEVREIFEEAFAGVSESVIRDIENVSEVYFNRFLDALIEEATA